MPKRKRSYSSDSSLSSAQSGHSLQQKSGIFGDLKLYLIQSKIDATEVELLTSLALSNGAIITPDLGRAEIIITRITMLRRLERHVPLQIAVCLFTSHTRIFMYGITEI